MSWPRALDAGTLPVAMSSPATPLAPGAAEAVPPVEKERYWWTPLALAIDRWLQPRWRALLTWVVLSAVSTWIAGHGEWIASASDFFLEHVANLLSFRLPMAVLQFAAPLSILLFVTWFPPVILRLGLARTALWLAISALLWLVLEVQSLAAFSSGSPQPVELHWMRAATVGGVGLPGLAVIGRRSRPWVSLIGGILTAGFFSVCPTELADSLWGWVTPESIYGAVMLYGTSPLPRKEGAR